MKQPKSTMLQILSFCYCSFSVHIHQELRAAFENEAKQSNKPRLLMSAAVSAGRGTIDSAYQIPKLGQ